MRAVYGSHLNYQCYGCGDLLKSSGEQIKEVLNIRRRFLLLQHPENVACKMSGKLLKMYLEARPVDVVASS